MGLKYLQFLKLTEKVFEINAVSDVKELLRVWSVSIFLPLSPRQKKFHSPDILQLLFPSHPHTVSSCMMIQGPGSTAQCQKLFYSETLRCW